MAMPGRLRQGLIYDIVRFSHCDPTKNCQSFVNPNKTLPRYRGLCYGRVSGVCRACALRMHTAHCIASHRMHNRTFRAALNANSHPTWTKTFVIYQVEQCEMGNIAYVRAICLLACFTVGVLGGCKTYWDGTAPFCKGSCPDGCNQLRRDDKGDGGNCWSGSKALCHCCGPQYPDETECIPTQTDTSCVGPVMICKNVMPGIIPSMPDRVCSTYACGACLNLGLGASGNNEKVVKLFNKYGADIDADDVPTTEMA